MKIPSKILRLIPTQINPIVIKELRQSVRSRLIAGVLLLFLTVELFGIGIILATSTTRINHIDYFAGRTTFHFLYIALSTACLLFIPAYAGVRLAMERWDNNLDLLYITTIQPRSVIRGKLFAAMTIALLLFSAAAPFMSFSYLLRGIDLPSIFMAIIFVYIYVIGITQVAIFLACLPTSKPFKVILGLVALAGLLWSLVIVNVAGWAMIHEGFGSKIKDPDFWVMASVIAVGLILGVGVLQRMSVALISPPSSNRSLPVRRYATISWLITGFGTFGISYYHSDGDIMMAWFIPAVIVMCMALIWGLSESTHLSARVQHTIPRTPIMRRLAFLFYNGPAGAMCWSAWLLLLSFVGTYCGILFIDSNFHNDITDWTQAFLSLSFYAIAYGMTSVFIWRKFLFRRLRCVTIGVITYVLIAIGALLPALVALLTKAKSFDWDVAWYVGNIFTIAEAKHIMTHTIFSSIWAVLAVLINGRWIMSQIKNFKPPEK